MAAKGTVVPRKPKSSKAKNPVVLNSTKAEQIQSSCDGAEGTDTPWSHATKREWIERFQRQGVDSKGKASKIYIHLDGVETADVDTGEIIPRPS